MPLIPGKNDITPSLSKIQKDLDNLAKGALKVWKDNTPIKSGNAKAKTVLKGNTIEANYAYAVRLDNGYSKQNTKGMSKPTEDFIKSELKKIIRK